MPQHALHCTGGAVHLHLPCQRSASGATTIPQHMCGVRTQRTDPNRRVRKVAMASVLSAFFFRGFCGPEAVEASAPDTDASGCCTSVDGVVGGVDAVVAGPASPPSPARATQLGAAPLQRRTAERAGSGAAPGKLAARLLGAGEAQRMCKQDAFIVPHREGGGCWCGVGGCGFPLAL